MEEMMAAIRQFISRSGDSAFSQVSYVGEPEVQENAVSFEIGFYDGSYMEITMLDPEA